MAQKMAEEATEVVIEANSLEAPERKSLNEAAG